MSIEEQSFGLRDLSADWSDLDLSILKGGRPTAPRLEDDYLHPFWMQFVRETAESTNAPPDFVAMPLLSTAAALIGNSRHVSPWVGWTEPTVLWIATVGLPGSGKTPAAKPVFEALADIELKRFPAYEERLAGYRRDSEEFQVRLEVWKKDVAAAVKSNKPSPLFDMQEPEKPVEPCLQANDATVEKLCLLLRDEPKGLLYRRDELSGWVECMDRYGNGGDRPFWLEAWSGGTYTQHRVKHDRPIRIDHLAVSIFGTTQPDKIARMLKNDPDDGLLQRFLWSMPDRVPYQRPQVTGDTVTMKAALGRLADLEMDVSESGNPVPRIIPLSPDAADAMEAFQRQMYARVGMSSGVMTGVFAKASGRMAQLALVLTYLKWAVSDDAEPIRVEIEEAVMAANLMADYFLPMAKRVFHEAALSQECGDAVAIARWIERDERGHVNPRSMARGEDRHPGTKDPQRIRSAIAVLIEWGVLAEPLKSGGFEKPRLDYPVNPKFLGS